MKSTQLISKPHYPILDGLRGVLAISVVAFHLLEPCYPDWESPMHHGYIAVEFFFMLSGFTIGYSYDDRIKKMSTLDFLKMRVVRLHPLVFLGFFIGAVCFWFDPFKNWIAVYTNEYLDVSFFKLIGVTLLSFTLLPTPDIHGWGETHSLNGNCWSLMQEYIAYLIYALFGERMNKMILWIMVIISGSVLAIVAAWHGDIAAGFFYENCWVAIVRMLFPFFAGLLLCRSGKLIRIPFAFFVCSSLMFVMFMLPPFKYNGLYEAACIIFAFPVLVAAGAGGRINERWIRLCRFLGAISYPIYIIHYPFVYIYVGWIMEKKPSPLQIAPVAGALFVFFILFAYLSLKLYDEPVRAWLKKKVLSR